MRPHDIGVLLKIAAIKDAREKNQAIEILRKKLC